MMRWGLSFLRGLVFSNIFIAICAVAMCWQTIYLYQLQEADALLPFVFFSTLCSYSFHWVLSYNTAGDSSRENWLKRYRRLHIALLIASFAGIAYYGISLLEWWHWLAASAVITFLYSAPKIPWTAFRWLRKVAYGKTIFLAMVWTHVTTVLPLVMSDTVWNNSFTLFVLGRFFLIYSICIIFDLRDREHDRSIGIRSLITWLNSRQIGRLFIFSLTVFVSFTILLFRTGFSITEVAILLLPGLLTALSYPIAVRKYSDLLYYGWLDGLMALSAFLFLLISLINW